MSEENDPAGLSIRLKRGLIFERINPNLFALVDPATGQKVQCTAQDFFILGHFNGNYTIEEISLLFENRFGQELEAERIKELALQLDRVGLLDQSSGEKAHASISRSRLSHEEEERLNHRFDLLVTYFGWLLNPFVAGLALLLAGWGAVVLVNKWVDFLSELSALFNERGATLTLLLFSIAQTVVVLNLPRELIIGMICRKLGGRISEFGLKWIGGLLPCFRCDYGTSLFLIAAYRRWILLYAGLWVILAVFGLSVLFWNESPHGSVLRDFWLILPAPCIIVFILNCVIFVQLDAYRILCFATKDWRLFDRSWAETKAWMSGGTSPEPLGKWERFWLRAYGIGYILWLAFSYGVIIPIILTWLAFTASGAGFFFGLGCFFWWHRDVIVQTMGRYSTMKKLHDWWCDPRNHNQVRKVQCILILVIILFPYSDDIEGGCRLISKANYGARAQLEDKIKEVEVKEGDYVQAGDLIAVLDGDQTRLDLKRAEDDLALQQADLFYWEGQLSRTLQLRQENSATEQQYQDALRGRDEAAQKVHTGEAEVAYWQTEVKEIEIRTPIAGIVALPDTQFKPGQYVQKGDLVAVVQDPKNLSVQVSANEQAGSYGAVGMTIYIRLYALDGMLRIGHVTSISAGPVAYSSFNDEPYRTDKERLHPDQSNTVEDRYIRICGDLDNVGKLTPGMTGFARIHRGYTPLVVAVVRPVWRFVWTDLWSWLP